MNSIIIIIKSNDQNKKQEEYDCCIIINTKYKSIKNRDMPLVTLEHYDM